MFGSEFDRAVAALGVAIFLAGAIVAAGLPWIWHTLIRPFLIWLAA